MALSNIDLSTPCDENDPMSGKSSHGSKNLMLEPKFLHYPLRWYPGLKRDGCIVLIYNRLLLDASRV